MGLLNDMMRCTTIRSDGEPCGQASAPKMPWPVCGPHALTLWRAMNKLVGGTSLDTPKARKAG